MTVRKISICVVLLLMIVPSFTQAQEARNGSVAASYLLIPVFWNPAGLVWTEKSINAMFSRRSYIADISINFAGASIDWEGFGTIAISLRSFDIGQIPVTTVFSPDGTG